jgi:para-nitrobenzyl esterase
MAFFRTLGWMAIAVSAASPAFSQIGVIGTDSGKLQGVVQGRLESFKGVPFAAPPVDKLRWRAPQPVQPWSGVRHANAYSADCMQVPFPSDARSDRRAQMGSEEHQRIRG